LYLDRLYIFIHHQMVATHKHTHTIKKQEINKHTNEITSMSVDSYTQQTYCQMHCIFIVRLLFTKYENDENS